MMPTNRAFHLPLPTTAPRIRGGFSWPDREADRIALKDAIEDWEQIPGARSADWSDPGTGGPRHWGTADW